MTYCVGIRLNAGLVFLSDSRTNAGLDQISIFRKMIVYEKPGDRFMTLLSSCVTARDAAARRPLRGPSRIIALYHHGIHAVSPRPAHRSAAAPEADAQ